MNDAVCLFLSLCVLGIAAQHAHAAEEHHHTPHTPAIDLHTSTLLEITPRALMPVAATVVSSAHAETTTLDLSDRRIMLALDDHIMVPTVYPALRLVSDDALFTIREFGADRPADSRDASKRTLLESAALEHLSLATMVPESPSPFTFHVGRTTALRDGGIEGARPTLDPTATDEQEDHLRSYAQAGGEFDLYDLSVEWAALRPGPLTLSVIGGVRAIRAEVNETRESTGPSGQSLTTFDDGRGVVTVPVVGGGVSWLLADGLHLRTTASTQSLPSGASYLDLVAETGIQLAPNISLTAGYQFVETRLEVDDIEAELDQEGLFARLQIRF